MYRTVETYVTRGAPAAPATPAAPPPANTWAPDDYVTNAQLAARGHDFVRQAVGGDIEAALRMAADANLDVVRRESGEIFSKYGPEVYNLLASVDKRQWSVDNLRKVVNMVKADHVNDIAREHAERIVAEMQPTLRSNGAPPAPVASHEPQHTLAAEGLPSDWKERAAKAGLTESAVDEFCRANNMTRADFFAQFGKTAITEVTRRG